MNKTVSSILEKHLKYLLLDEHVNYNITVISRNIELEGGASSSSILREFNIASNAISMGAQWEGPVQC